MNILCCCRHMCEIGVGLTTYLLCTFALAIIRQRIPSKKLAPKKDWARKFRKRNNLSLRKGSVLSKARYTNNNPRIFTSYFSKLEDLYSKLNVSDKPNLIWNMDETYFGKKQEGNNRKVISPKGSQQVHQRQFFTATHTTVLACINAAGIYMPPVICYTDSLPSERYLQAIPEEWSLCWTGSGYISTQVFEQWFEKVFVERCGATAEQPAVLIMDNCSTHFSMKVIDLAIERNIHIMCEPAHTSHRLQPLDKIFHSIQDEFEQQCLSSQLVDLDSTVTKGCFTMKLRQAILNRYV